MRKALLIVVLALSLQSCASLNPISALAGKPSIEANVQAAKNAEQEKNVVKLEQGNTEQKADTISNDTSYQADVVNQITKNIGPFELMLIFFGGLFIGWLLPDPPRVWQGVTVVIKDIFNGLVVNPFRGLANFILALFGREQLGNSRTKTETDKAPNDMAVL